MDSIYTIYNLKTGNCEAYTMLTNYMLYLSGIPTATATNLTHGWTVAFLDGEWIYIDSTNNLFGSILSRVEKISFAYDGLVYIIDNPSEGAKVTGIAKNQSEIDALTTFTIPTNSYMKSIYSTAFDTDIELKAELETIGAEFIKNNRKYHNISDDQIAGKNTEYIYEEPDFNMTKVSYSELTPTRVKLTWDAVEDADEYVIKDVKENRIMSYIPSRTLYRYISLTPATMYEFEVTARKDVNGGSIYSKPYKVSFFTRPNTVTGLKATATTTSAITLKWNAQSNVKGYKIYRYDSKTKKYKYYAKTTRNTYTAKKLSAGTTYSFRVVAYMTVNSADYSGATSATLKIPTRPKTPTIKKITTKSRKANLNWGKVTGTTGYEIYMKSSKNGKYKKIKTITKAGTIKYTKSSLKKGKRYYFRIRAYKKVDGKTYYSSFSTTKSIVIK